MPAKPMTTAQLTEAVQLLRQEVGQLTARLAVLETAKNEAPRNGESAEELLLTISAAVAAYLGVQPRIRQIRLLHSNTWAQQGRVIIQASHALTAR